MDGKSLTPQEGKLKQLQEILPEAFTEGKIDWEKLKATLGDDINFGNERYVLNWAGKSEAFKVLQTPSTKTLVPAKDESVNFDETRNIFIEGENLEVLKVLQKSYFGKIKMIYIDPPYNTGNDSFIYPDKFTESKEEYQKRVGDKNGEGYMTKEGMFHKNSKENGQYHSNWLNMMYPRLFLAKNLLRQDGVIFVSIDDNEVHNLRLMMNEVFGEENFVEAFVWRSRLGKGSTSKKTAKLHEHIICYGKDAELLQFNGDVRVSEKENKERIRQLGQGDNREDRPTMYYPVISDEFGEVYPKKSNGKDGRWRISKSEFKKLQEMKLVVFEKQEDGRVEAYRIIHKGTKTETAHDSILDSQKVKTTAHGSIEISQLFETKVFDYPKPTTLVTHFLEIINKEDSLVLDFFAGSATTAHAVMDLNAEDGGHRKYICVQLPELCDEKSEAYKAGYKTIADIAKERIRRVIKIFEQDYTGLYKKGKIERIKEEETAKQGSDLFKKDNNPVNHGNPENPVQKQDLGFKVLKLSDSNFKQWRSDLGKDAEALKQQIIEFVDPVAPNATIENMVYELLLKSGKDLNSKLEHKDNYYCVSNNELVLMLEKADQITVEAVIKENPQKVVALDRLFEGNDQLKTNTALRMRDAGIEFKTI